MLCRDARLTPDPVRKSWSHSKHDAFALCNDLRGCYPDNVIQITFTPGVNGVKNNYKWYWNVSCIWTPFYFSAFCTLIMSLAWMVFVTLQPSPHIVAVFAMVVKPDKLLSHKQSRSMSCLTVKQALHLHQFLRKRVHHLINLWENSLNPVVKTPIPQGGKDKTEAMWLSGLKCSSASSRGLLTFNIVLEGKHHILHQHRQKTPHRQYLMRIQEIFVARENGEGDIEWGDYYTYLQSIDVKGNTWYAMMTYMVKHTFPDQHGSNSGTLLCQYGYLFESCSKVTPEKPNVWCLMSICWANSETIYMELFWKWVCY